jgi:hypothetical protein
MIENIHRTELKINKIIDVIEPFDEPKKQLFRDRFCNEFVN